MFQLNCRMLVPTMFSLAINLGCPSIASGREIRSENELIPGPSSQIELTAKTAAVMPAVIPLATALALWPYTHYSPVLGGLTLGSGHLYAGDVGKAALYSIAMPASVLTAAFIGYKLDEHSQASNPDQATATGNLNLLGTGLVYIVFCGLASYDAYKTVLSRKTAQEMEQSKAD